MWDSTLKQIWVRIEDEYSSLARTQIKEVEIYAKGVLKASYCRMAWRYQASGLAIPALAPLEKCEGKIKTKDSTTVFPSQLHFSLGLQNCSLKCGKVLLKNKNRPV